MNRSALQAALASTAMLALVPAAASAQHATANAVSESEDAFGTNIGLESSGIYTEFDTRGFSPTKAGNVRIDGIYFDPVAITAGRLRDRTAIRVGFAAEDYPFHAPTGIVDHKFRTSPARAGVSGAWHQQAHSGHIAEFDFRLPLADGKIGLTGGIALSNSIMADGSGSKGYGYTVRPIMRFGGIEVAPFFSLGGFKHVRARPLLIAAGNSLPALPEVARTFSQPWAEGKTDNGNQGVTVKAPLTGRLSLRAGLFHSVSNRIRNYSEIFTLQPGGLVSHRLIADPRQNVHSTSGEAQLAWRFASGKVQHRIIAGFRARDRHTETGGSQVVTSPNLVAYGQYDPIDQPAPAFSPVNQGTVRQSSILLGYTGKLEGVGLINLGLQKARYRGLSRDGRTGLVTATRDDPWLYNATLGLDLSRSVSFYVGTETGLEDSGTAPESAVNRNDQLPPTRSRQFETGLRWKFEGGQLVVNAFQITKPYFTFDGTGSFVPQGEVRHRGVETSLSGRFGKRFSVVAGAVAMKPRISGGGRPVGTPSLYARADLNYRTDIFGGLTPTASIAHTGSRLVNPTLEVAGYSSVDLGLRQQFRIAGGNASIRAVAQNVFDAASWKVVAANTLYPEERRRFTISLTTDF